MFIIDAHLDLAWNALQWNRDLLKSVYTIRTREVNTPGRGRAKNTVALPDLREGRVGLCFATLLARSTGNAVAHVDYDSAQQANAIARGQLAYYRALEAGGHVRIITNRVELDDHIDEWNAWDSQAEPDPITAPPLGFVISMESADPILKPADVEKWLLEGVRAIGPAHYGSGRYVGGTGVENGFNDDGLALLDEMERAGVILDLTHLTDTAFWQAVEHYNGPVLASHNNCRTLVPHQRQFSDEQLRAIIERDGVIGAAFDAWMLEPGWIKGESSNENVTIEMVVDHIDHVCQLAGNSLHVGIGSDLDGGFGREQSPCDLDTIADLQKVGSLLAERGYNPDDVANIMHGNWLRLLRWVWARS